MSKEMKDSGIQWAGTIPENWKIEKGKYCFKQQSHKGNKESSVLLSPTQKYGVIPQDMYEELSGFTAVKLNENINLNQLKTVHKGAFVISLRSFQGGFEYSEYEGVVSPAYQVFYPSVPVCDFYYKYLFNLRVNNSCASCNEK
jgi:type I restriction enzyme S subunit